MEIEQVRLELSSGTLKGAMIEPSATGNGWMMLFKHESGERVKLTDHSGAEKVFHSLEAATRAAQEIGFQTIHIEERF